MLREPDGYFLVIKQWHRDACPDYDCAVALLSFLMFFHKHKATIVEYSKITNAMLRSQGKPPIADETLWQFHTDKQLQAKLFFWKEETIGKAIKYLELKGYIRTDAPEYLQKLYKTGRTKWFLIQEEKLKTFLKRYDSENPDEEFPVEQLKPMERGKKVNERREAGKRIFRFWMLYNNETTTIDETRLRKIIARLKDGKSELDLIRAVIGNKVSPWHRGENPNSKNGVVETYHQIKHIFPSIEQVESMIKHADARGFPPSEAIKEYERVLGIAFEGEVSTDASAEVPKESAIVINNSVYSEAGRMLKRMVVDEQLTMDKCFEAFCNQSGDLEFSIIELRDPEILADHIIEIISETEIIAEVRKVKIREFAKKFLNKLRGNDTDNGND